MGRIQFTVEDWELRYFRDFANRKGMTVSQLAKISIFQYEARHGLKTLSMDNYRPLPKSLARSTAAPLSGDM